jgi:hypothetical protein
MEKDEDLENPDPENPDLENPDLENPDLENLMMMEKDEENLETRNQRNVRKDVQEDLNIKCKFFYNF